MTARKGKTLPKGGNETASDARTVRVPVARSKAATRAILWAVPALVLSTITLLIYQRLSFSSSAVSSRLVDGSIALAALPLGVAAVVSGIKGVRWLLLALWPGAVGIYAAEDALTLRLGLFGTRRYDASRLEVLYLFEQLAESEEATFEAFLPEEEQRVSLLPTITHPDAVEPINRIILRYANGSEAQIAAMLRPMVDRWRANASGRSRADAVN